MTEGPSPRDKRLIISGLTPAITDQDIRSRFTAFGTVKAVDGVGLLDGNGDPRKFAFVTVEINEQELFKCMSRLNGTKWKGAKLRIGEARPDLNAGACVPPDNDPKGIRTSSPPEKRQKLSQSHGTGGRHAADMSLTTPENVDSRKHWKRTPLGQLVRPVRMRPDRPIPPLPQMARSPSTSDQPATKRKGSKPLKRAKFTVIDPTRYGSTHLTATTGTFGAEVWIAQDRDGAERTTVGGGRERDIRHDRDPEADRTTSTSDETSSEDGVALDEAEILSSQDDHSTIAKRGGPVTEDLPPLSQSADEESLHIRDDKKRDLDILASLLGNQETLAWEPDSDLEELAWENSDKRRNELEVETDADGSSPETEIAQPEHAPWDVDETPVKAAPLKEMFAPRPDESGFSLFDNIADLDIELEEPDVELDFQNFQSHREQEHPEVLNHHPRGSVPDITLDRSAPFFFPLPRNIRGIPDSSFGLPSSRHPSSQAIQDVFDGGTSNSLESAGFWRVETDDDIRKYWEETKGELTREYKLRHREASRRLKPFKGAIKSTDF